MGLNEGGFAGVLGLDSVVKDEDEDLMNYDEDDKMDISGDVFNYPDDDVMNLDEDEEMEDDYKKWKEIEENQEWAIIYSKKPEVIIDKDEYDKILLNLLLSY